MLAHKLRPKLIYVDASHANPDVFIDYENFYTILAPGGAMAVDDVGIVPAVRKAFDALVEAYGLSPKFYDTRGGRSNQAVVRKPTRNLIGGRAARGAQRWDARRHRRVATRIPTLRAGRHV